MTITLPHIAIIFTFGSQLDDLIEELEALRTNADCLEMHAVSVKDEFHSVIDDLEGFSGSIDTIVETARTSMKEARKHALK